MVFEINSKMVFINYGFTLENGNIEDKNIVETILKINILNFSFILYRCSL